RPQLAPREAVKTPRTLFFDYALLLRVEKNGARSRRRRRHRPSSIDPRQRLLDAGRGPFHSSEGSRRRRCTRKGDAARWPTRTVRELLTGGSVAATVARGVSGVLIGVVIAAAIAGTSTAKAALLGTERASFCDSNPAQVFAPWGDSSYYATLQNGDFETGSTAWHLSGGARVVAGN